LQELISNKVEELISSKVEEHAKETHAKFNQIETKLESRSGELKKGSQCNPGSGLGPIHGKEEEDEGGIVIVDKNLHHEEANAKDNCPPQKPKNKKKSLWGSPKKRREMMNISAERLAMSAVQKKVDPWHTQPLLDS